MPRRIEKILLVALLVVLAIFSAVAMLVDDWSRDLSTNRAATSTGNSDLLLRSLELPASPAEVRDAVIQFVEQRAAWALGNKVTGKNSRGAEREASVPLVRTSRLFRFADDLQIFLQPIETGTLVDVVSQSRVGNGDFGQNPRNIRELMLALRKHFGLPMN